MPRTVTVEIDKRTISADAIAAVEVDGVALAVCKIGERYCAFHDSCTHEEWPLSEGYLVDGRLVCSLHGAEYDPATGACLRGPVADDLRTYAVYENGEQLRIEMEIEE